MIQTCSIGKKPDDLIEIMNIEISKVVQWLKLNKLSLNLKKTHFIIFRRKRGKILLKNEMFIDGVKIEMTTKSKFLGEIIDETLSFSYPIQFIKGKNVKVFRNTVQM